MSTIIQRIGEAGGKLHTGRSRNDQVATDMHLYTKEQVQYIIELIASFQETIVQLADQHVDTIMPGYAFTTCTTHLVRTYYDLRMLERDKGRFMDES